MSSGQSPLPRPNGEAQTPQAHAAQPGDGARDSRERGQTAEALPHPQDLSANARHVLSYLYQQINADLRSEAEIARNVGLPPEECNLALRELHQQRLIWAIPDEGTYNLTSNGRTLVQDHAAELHTVNIMGDVSGAAVNIGPGFIKAENITAVGEPFPISPTHAKTVVELLDAPLLKAAIRETVRETLTDDEVIRRIAEELVRQIGHFVGVPPSTITVEKAYEGSIIVILAMPTNIARHLYDLMPPEKRRPLAHPAPRPSRRRPGTAALTWLRRLFNPPRADPAQDQLPGIWTLFIGLSMLLMAAIALLLLSTNFGDGALFALSGSMILISLLLLGLYLNNRTYTWASWAAYIMFSTAVVIAVGFLYEDAISGRRSLVMISGLVALFVSLPFLRAYITQVWIGNRATDYWWTILVAGGTGTLALSILQLVLGWPSESLPGALTAAFMGGVTLTLFLLWLPNYRDQMFEWAIWPAIATFVLAVFGGLWAFDVLELALPLLFLLIGVIFVVVFFVQATRRP